MGYHNCPWGMQKINSHCAQKALSKVTFEKTQKLSIDAHNTKTTKEKYLLKILTS